MGIATPVCALARNDPLLQLFAKLQYSTPQRKNHAEIQRGFMIIRKY